MSTPAALPNGVSREEAQLLTEAIIMVRKQNAQREKVMKAEEKKNGETKRSGTLCWKSDDRWEAPEGSASSLHDQEGLGSEQSSVIQLI